MPAKPNSPQLLPVDLYELTTEDKKRFAEERALGMAALNDPVLNAVAQAVAPSDITSQKIKDVVTRLMTAAQNQQAGSKNNKKRRTLVGLAAPQIGESLRIIVVDTKMTPDRKGTGKLECFINPEIIWRSRETAEGREGCFSAGPVWGLVRRPIAVKMRALTTDGKPTERIFEDFTARIFQHELDHLNGIRFPERITSDRKRHWVHTEELELHKQSALTWHRICTLKRWNGLKVVAEIEHTKH